MDCNSTKSGKPQIRRNHAIQMCELDTLMQDGLPV